MLGPKRKTCVHVGVHVHGTVEGGSTRRFQPGFKPKLNSRFIISPKKPVHVPFVLVVLCIPALPMTTTTAIARHTTCPAVHARDGKTPSSTVRLHRGGLCSPYG